MSPASVEPDPARSDIDTDADSCEWQGDSGCSEVCGEHVLLVDRLALDELGEDFDSQTVVQDFVRDFAQSWEGKYLRLARSVHQRDQSRAKEGALSVKVTSIMVGATRLAHLVTQIEQFVDSDDMRAAARILTCVEACGLQTRAELLQNLESPGDTREIRQE